MLYQQIITKQDVKNAIKNRDLILATIQKKEMFALKELEQLYNDNYLDAVKSLVLKGKRLKQNNVMESKNHKDLHETYEAMNELHIQVQEYNEKELHRLTKEKDFLTKVWQLLRNLKTEDYNFIHNMLIEKKEVNYSQEYCEKKLNRLMNQIIDKL